ncbi:MAG: hypothetical protein COA67_01945 [Lutibacter sp.]|nr:MAG: hypothetical protein COA67_01945 [Lutibacter sp.]
MKKILNILVLFSLVFIYSCDDNADFNIDAPEITAGEMSAIVGVRSTSDGKLLGAPSSTDLSTATVAFSDTSLELEVYLLSGGVDVSSYELMKSINGGPEVTVATSATLPISISYSTLTDFIGDLGLAEPSLRIGDVIKFRTKFVHTDGSIAFSGPNEGTFSVTINCSADLTGNYTMTNTVCGSVFTVAISANPDGTWHITRGDGGLLSLCSTNGTLLNPANITVVCGEVLATGDLDYGTDGSGHGIGDITGGNWDANTGTLTMSHTDAFFSWSGGSYESTYVRQ